MTFKEWILSDYFDTNNPYNLWKFPLDSVRDYVTEYGSTNIQLLSAAGSAFNPDICIEDYIIANMVYSLRNSGFGAQ